MNGPSPSLWIEQLGEVAPRAPLDGDDAVDVVVVGGGYTGLWTAYSLLRAEPSMRVLVVERETVGFGASGRNGGWCVGELAGGLRGAVAAHGRDGGIRLTRAIMATVAEVGRIVHEEQIDCGFHQGGVVRLARNGAQLARQRDELTEYEAHGFGDELAPLSADEARGRLAATEVLGGLFYAPAARVQPAALARGLADAVERLGGRIVEQTAVEEILPGRPPAVRTSRGKVRAGVVVRATEGYTSELPGHARTLVPLYSLMVATEPLDDDVWAQIGLADRETFADDRHMVIYGQRTTDGRIAFGGRGARYRYGSTIDPATEHSSVVHDRIAATLVELLPVLEGVAVTHRWGGVLGVPRDWRPSVGFDPQGGVAWAGGYVGEGVAAANLAGRTLADLVRGVRSELTALGWVDHRSRLWEREPVRWLGINAAIALMQWADRGEDSTGSSSRVAALVERAVRRSR